MESICHGRDTHDDYNDHDYCTAESLAMGSETNVPQPELSYNKTKKIVYEASSKPVKIRVEDFGKCCRLCLTQSGHMIPLAGACLNLMLQELYNIQIHTNDGYPQNICKRCSTKVSSAHCFYKLVFKSKQELTDVLMASEMPVTVKTSQVIDNGSHCEDPGTLEMAEMCCDSNTMHILSDTTRKANEMMIEGCLKKDFSSKNLMVEMATLQKNLMDFHDDETTQNCGQSDAEVNETNEGCQQKHSETNLEDIDKEDKAQTKLMKTKCELCGKKYKTLDMLFAHNEMAHKGNKLHLCSYCGARFSWASSLARHARTHTRRGLHACEACPRAFTTRSYLRIHEASHTDTRYNCKICSYGFTQMSSLHKHMRRRHSHDPEPVCVSCNTPFDTRELLASHLRETHGEEMTYKCTLCEDVFTEAKDCDLHLKLVHKKKKKHVRPSRPACTNIS
ncbi:unnamed protein product [Plutella xylostella]|uniref:(diamondback moth) hypothetical protein n=1 Tax=Plutella xylostella TaxID=51655 RepID=A0A8S4DWD0_PLUXY|nr:unnamed protein product [Plutella xylostella]